MEEDIEILESIVKVHNDFLKGCDKEIITEKEIKALERLLQAYKELVIKTKKQNERNKKQQEENKKLNEKILNQKGQLKALNISYKEDEKIIKNMVNIIMDSNEVEKICEKIPEDDCDKFHNIGQCKECIEQYFRKKVRDEQEKR